MESKRGFHKFFIEAHSDNTNEILGKNQRFLSEDQLYDGVKCADGKPHQLWGCPNYSFVKKLVKNKDRFGVDFTVWHQEGGGIIKEWVFPKPELKPKKK